MIHLRKDSEAADDREAKRRREKEADVVCCLYVLVGRRC